MDVISVNQAGVTNAVATLGTALTNEQAMLMKRYSDDIIICYDADEAGQKATARAIPIRRKAGLKVRVLTVPSGKDPDEFIRAKGKDGPAAFRALIDKSGNDVEYQLGKLKQKYNVNSTDGRVKYLEEAAKIVAAIESPIERNVYVSRICGEFEIQQSAFMDRIKSIKSRSRRDNNKKEIRKLQTDLSGRSDKINTEHYKKPRSSSAEEALLVYLIKNPDSAEEISARVKPEQFQNSLVRRYYEYVIGRIKNGLEPLNNLTADFTESEVSKLYEFMSRSVSSVSTKEAMTEYINVINEESLKLTAEAAADLPPEEMKAYIDRMRKLKQ